MSSKLTVTEPVSIAAGVVALAQAVLTALVLLGALDLTAEQTAALMAVVTSGVALAVAIWARGRVTPTLDR